MCEANERERLVKLICKDVRSVAPHQRIDDYFRMKRRLQKTRLEVLRSIAQDQRSLFCVALVRKVDAEDIRRWTRESKMPLWAAGAARQ